MFKFIKTAKIFQKVPKSNKAQEIKKTERFTTVLIIFLTFPADF